MSRRTTEYTRAVMTRPARAEPQTFVFKHTMDREWRWHFERDPHAAVMDLRHLATRKLAKFIADNCHFFDASSLCLEDPEVRIEITLNDLGAYENLIPSARREQAVVTRKETLAEVKAATPYGLLPDEQSE